MNTFGEKYADIYDLLYHDKDYQGEVNYIEQIIQRHFTNARSILDLGCGTGKHAVLLADRGYQVHGVDLSSEMLEIAKKNRTNSSNPSFQAADIRHLDLEQSFDVIIALFHVLSYQTNNDDLSRTFSTIAKHLKPNGIFIADGWYGPGVLTQQPTVRIKRLQNNEYEVFRIAEPVMGSNCNTVAVNYQTLIRSINTGMFEEFIETHLMRYLFIPELELFIDQACLTIESIYQYLTFEAPSLNSWNFCLVGKRKI